MPKVDLPTGVSLWVLADDADTDHWRRQTDG